jgi:sulfite exporter TauE/SafE
MFLAALSTGSPLSGAALLGAFALGGAPALAAVQLGAGRIHISPMLRRGVLLGAAALLIFRALSMHPEVNQCG